MGENTECFGNFRLQGYVGAFLSARKWPSEKTIGCCNVLIDCYAKCIYDVDTSCQKSKAGGRSIDNTSVNLGESILIYPNPIESSDNLINIVASEQIKIVELFDLSGRLIFIKTNVFNNNVKLENQFLESGIYSIRITDINNKKTIKKIIKL